MFQALCEDRGLWFPGPEDRPSLWLDCILDAFCRDSRRLRLLLDQPALGWMRLGLLLEELFPIAYEAYLAQIDSPASRQVADQEPSPSEEIRMGEAPVVILDPDEPAVPGDPREHALDLPGAFPELNLPW
jgi:hypothetical protein